MHRKLHSLVLNLFESLLVVLFEAPELVCFEQDVELAELEFGFLFQVVLYLVVVNEFELLQCDVLLFVFHFLVLVYEFFVNLLSQL